MNVFEVANAPTADSLKKKKTVGEKSAHEDFFETHREFYRHYVRDSSIVPKSSSEAPVDVPTMAVDLENGSMYVNPAFFEDRKYSPDKVNFGVCHELEHVLELKELLSQKEGEKIWKKHLEKLAKKRYAIADNIIGDIKMNRSVLKKASILEKTRENLYRDNLFPDSDFTKLPKHLQFSYALGREGNLAGEECLVAPEVRAKIDELKNKRSRSGVSLVDYATSPFTSMAMRIKLQEMYFYPIIDQFFDEDARKKEEEDRAKKEKKQGGKSEGEDSSESEENNGDSGENGEEGDDKKKKSKSKKGKGKSDKNQSSQEVFPDEGSGETGELPKNPEDYFQEEYADYDAKNPQAISVEDIQKAVEKYVESQKGGKSQEEMSREVYAKAEGVTVQELNEYERFWHELEKIENPETGETVIEELRTLFQKIINERKKKKYMPKIPTEEGEILAYPAEAVIQVRQGEHQPKVWETVESKEKPREMFGDFDVTVVADRSSSMRGQKAGEQRKAVALILEALKDFSDQLDEANKDIEYYLNVRTESWSFGDENQIEVLKPLAKELTEKQRVYVYKKLADTPGGKTLDFTALKKILDSLISEDLDKISQKKLKKIIIVMSDGESWDGQRNTADLVQAVLKDLREKGVVVVGVGITNGGASIVETYAPDGRICENPADLAKVLSELLKNELKEL